MSLQYQRNVEVTIYRPGGEGFFGVPGANAIVVRELRIEFEIQKTLKKEPNTCEIKIWNLTRDTRSALTANPLAVLLHAGYDGERRLMFSGDVRHAPSLIEGPDWITTIRLGDGARAFRHARVNRSYTGGTVGDVVRDAAAAMGLQVPASVMFSTELAEALQGGEILAGAARDELTRLLDPYGMTWSIQDGRLVVLREDQVHRDTSVLVSQAEGMIGSPVFGAPEKGKKKPPLTVRMTLRPDVVPGGTLVVRSDDVNGKFRAETVKHHGINLSDEFLTEVTCKQV